MRRLKARSYSKALAASLRVHAATAFSAGLHQSIAAFLSRRAEQEHFRDRVPAIVELRASTEGAPTEILLYDEIGYWGITASDFVAALAQAGDGPIVLRINSPGGDVFDGYAIYNALKARQATVSVVVDGIAASAASFIAMAGSTIGMGEASMLMIHNAQGLCYGDRNDMAEMVAIMAKIDGQIAAIYAGKSGKPAADFATMMDAETWLTADEAKAAGLCDVVLGADESQTAKLVMRAGRARAELARSELARSVVRPEARRVKAMAPYDPDGDGDNDAQEALDHICAAMTVLGAAADCLTGNLDEDDAGEGQGEDNEDDKTARRGRRAASGYAAAATSPEWQCGASQSLPLNTEQVWDGAAATERMLEAAGFNGESPDPAKAKRGFLAWDHHNPKLKGSYKLPFADVVDGTLTALKSGIDAAASRLPDADLPEDVKTNGRGVLDAYEKRMGKSDQASRLDVMRNRLRLVEAEVMA